MIHHQTFQIPFDSLSHLSQNPQLFLSELGIPLNSTVHLVPAYLIDFVYPLVPNMNSIRIHQEAMGLLSRIQMRIISIIAICQIFSLRK